MKPKILVLSGYGINCERETKFAFDRAGGEADIIHVNDLISKKTNLSDYHILVFPGGFSYGDDIGSGNAMANKIKLNLWEEIVNFIDSGKLMIGICNGFQIIVNLGLLPALDGHSRNAALTFNNSARYECRWVNIKKQSDKCVFTKNIDEMSFPVAHGEGKFFADDRILQKLNENGQIIFRYIMPDGSPANGRFPYNPNGSLQDIAGICDTTGRVLGMMPHPERAMFSANLPNFQKLKEKSKRENLEIPEYYAPATMIFKNAVEYIKENFVNQVEKEKTNDLNKGTTYSESGVDVDENHLANDMIKKLVPFTFDDKVVSGLEGLFSAGYRFDRSKGNFVGQKIVCVDSEESLGINIQSVIKEIENEQGTPLFLTDYLAFGKLRATNAASLVLKIIENAKNKNNSFIPLIGGEVAEMPGVIKEDDFEIVIVFTYQTSKFKKGLIDMSGLEGDILTTSNDSVGTKTKLGLQLNLVDGLFKDMIGHSVGDVGVQSAIPLGIAMYVGHSPDFYYKRELSDSYPRIVQSSQLINLDFKFHEKDIYFKGQFDIVGSILGIVKEEDLLTGENIEEGDYLIGWKSFGLNTNGYSLIRKLGDKEKIDYNEMLPGTGINVGEALMHPHEDYREVLKNARDLFGKNLKGVAHITGGGIEANTIRLFPKNKKLSINIESLPDNLLFKYLQQKGNLSEEEMDKTFNRGIGIVFVVNKEFNINNLLEDYHLVGRVTK
ncbi:phosphoribosylformylglycinamidine synthase I [Candidatus Pacearchaeota archaeon]|nr:phosphoribosylformylglycinamidine synthase I [Candidatus Pacearchaeota archaeon]MBD3283384.1 phosphoribosylformylglycinamidine synthase I [Candidatus Pacearchaeota archaeon]